VGRGYLIDACIHVFREPRGRLYKETTIARLDDEVSLLGFPDVRLHVSEILE